MAPSGMRKSDPQPWNTSVSPVRHILKQLEFERSGSHPGTVHCDRAADALVLSGLPDGRKRMLQEEWPDFAQDCAADAVIQETRTKRHPWRSFHAEAIE